MGRGDGDGTGRGDGDGTGRGDGDGTGMRLGWDWDGGLGWGLGGGTVCYRSSAQVWQPAVQINNNTMLMPNLFFTCC